MTTVIQLWRAGMNTNQIARRLSRAEHKIEQELHKLLYPKNRRRGWKACKCGRWFKRSGACTCEK